MGKDIFNALRRFGVACVCAVCLLPLTARAINTVYFNPSATGEIKSVPNWGVDAAWDNADNLRQSIEHIGAGNVDLVRIPFFASEPLINNRGVWSLNSTAKAEIDSRLSHVTAAGTNVPISLVPSGTDAASIDASYVSGSGINVSQYALLIKTTQAYINSKSGYTGSPVYAIEPFNEPDYNFANANTTDLNNIIAQLKTYPQFSSTLMMAGSALNSDQAQNWYGPVTEATAGSSHLLAGSLTTWTNFIDNVTSGGKPFLQPEIHSMGEILAGAEHGMTMGMVWADVLRGRGTLIQASDGARLGYAEDLAHNSAGAVYRAPDGKVYAFAGGVERDYMGSPSAYRFVSNQDVYFNGIPVREFMLQTKNDEYASATDNDFANYGSASHEGAFATIETDPNDVMPALDGYRWKIVNAYDGMVMEVANSGTGDGANIVSATDDGGLNQMWQITRTRNGYYHFYNANSGKTAEVAGSPLNNGANVQQWGSAEDSTKQWYIEKAGNGAFYIRNAYSNMYMDGQLDGTAIYQWEGNGGLNQKWLFVPANPTDGPADHYSFHGNVLDSAGTNHGTAYGSPVYTTGPDGTSNGAIRFDGINDYVQLPSAVSNSEDITISTWVKWNGGAAWQRIFDFGDNTTNYMFLTPSSDEGVMHFAITTGSDPGEEILETARLPVGEWVHLALTLGGNTAVLYLNGVPQVAGQILLDPTDISPLYNYIGKSLWSQDPLFNGAMSDFRIFDYALDQSQVLELANPADADHDGDVDGADFLIIQRTDPSLIPLWQQHYGQSNLLAAATAVPEPATATLLLALAVFAGVRPRPSKRT